jgi:hypothetical protein
MANNFNFIDFYICYPGHPMFKLSEVIEDDVVRVIVQKYEMIIFTNKGELFGDLNFGGDLTKLLHETRLSAESIEENLKGQIADYISEIDEIGYELTVEFFDDPERHQEYMVINFTIADYNVFATVS